MMSMWTVHDQGGDNVTSHTSLTNSLVCFQTYDCTVNTMRYTSFPPAAALKSERLTGKKPRGCDIEPFGTAKIVVCQGPVCGSSQLAGALAEDKKPSTWEGDRGRFIGPLQSESPETRPTAGSSSTPFVQPSCASSRRKESPGTESVWTLCRSPEVRCLAEHAK